MPYEFTEYEPDPETQASASRSMGPPRKGVGVDVLDAPGGTPWPGIFHWPGIAIWVGILGLLAGIGALLAAFLLHR